MIRSIGKSKAEFVTMVSSAKMLLHKLRVSTAATLTVMTIVFRSVGHYKWWNILVAKPHERTQTNTVITC